MTQLASRLVIRSRRPGREWGVRNDRLEVEDGSARSYEEKLARRRAEAERQVQGWLAVEPDTEFRVEEKT
jgi:hypothetical protein